MQKPKIDLRHLKKVTNDVYYKHYWTTDRYLVFYGGAGSGKSHFCAQKIIRRLVGEDVAHRFLVLRKYSPDLELSAFKLIKDYLIKWRLWEHCKVTVKPMHVVFLPNGNEIYFRGLDDMEKVKCYSEDTDVLTKDGWKSVKEVQVGDSLATYNKGKAEYQPVSKKFEYDYKGKMIEPASATGDRRAYLDFCVTPNHNMFGFRRVYRQDKSYVDHEMEFCRADSIPCNFKIPRTAEWTGKRQKHITIPRLKGSSTTKPLQFETDKFLRVLGWYLSEGNAPINNRYQINISQVYPQHRKNIIKDIEAIGYKCWQSERYLSFSGKNIHNYFKQFGDSYSKFIPRSILDLHPDHLKHLFETMVDGDGHIEKTGRVTYSTSSKQLADDFCELAVKLGYRVGGKIQPTPHADSYRIYVNKDREYTSLAKTKEVDYDGKIYCFEVPPCHTVLTRRNGCVMWCGQSIENITSIWYEESTEASEQDVIQLDLRLRPTFKHNCKKPELGCYPQIMFSYNPISKQKWTYKAHYREHPKSYRKKIKTQIEYRGKTEEITSYMTVVCTTYKDNIYLDPQYVASLEELINRDAAFHKIYAKGEYADVKNKIYNNYTVVDEFPSVDYERKWYGLDFGFTHPMALIEINKVDDLKRHLRTIFYKSGYNTKDLIEWLDDMKFSKSDVIYADSAEPDRIKQIRDAGYNIRPAYKGQNSVGNGIDYCRQLDVLILRKDIPLREEFYSYKYKEDRDGNIVYGSDGKEQPAKFKDDAMDAWRYGEFTYYIEGNKSPTCRIIEY